MTKCTLSTSILLILGPISVKTNLELPNIAKNRLHRTIKKSGAYSKVWLYINNVDAINHPNYLAMELFSRRI